MDFNNIIEKAFWISPTGKILFLTKDQNHIQQVIDNPRFFNLAFDQIQQIYNKNNEQLGVEGKAREEIIKDLINRGWVRIRKYYKPDHWTINVPKINNHIKDALKDWADYMLKHGEGKYSEVLLDLPYKQIKYSLEDISNDVLYLNEKISKKRFKIQFKRYEKFWE